MLGKAETLLVQSAPFDSADVKRRLFAKTDRQPEAPRVTFATPNEQDGARHLREVAGDVGPVARLLVDRDGTLVHTNERLRTLFGLSLHDIGRPLQDLELSYRPFELPSRIDHAYRDHRPISSVEGRWTGPGGEVVVLELTVVPLLDRGGLPLGASVYFTDVTGERRLQEDVQRASQDRATALEELQSANEELETTNEELQSTVEELETTNEELQSTNEELETMNEELQSTNVELQALNHEAHERGDQMREVTGVLESILTSLRGAVAVVDRDFHVRKWSHRAEDMWGLRQDEVLHKNFLDLDIGLPVERLKAPIRACLAREADCLDLILEATNRLGRPIQVRVACTPFATGAADEPRGVILLMEESDGHS